VNNLAQEITKIQKIEIHHSVSAKTGIWILPIIHANHATNLTHGAQDVKKKEARWCAKNAQESAFSSTKMENANPRLKTAMARIQMLTRVIKMASSNARDAKEGFSGKNPQR